MTARRTITFSFPANSPRASCASIINSCPPASSIRRASSRFTPHSFKAATRRCSATKRKSRRFAARRVMSRPPGQAQRGTVRAPVHQAAGALRCRVPHRHPRLAQCRLGVDAFALRRELRQCSGVEPSLHGEHQVAALGYIEILDGKGGVSERIAVGWISSHRRPRLWQSGDSLRSVRLPAPSQDCPRRARPFARQRSR